MLLSEHAKLVAQFFDLFYTFFRQMFSARLTLNYFFEIDEGFALLRFEEILLEKRKQHINELIGFRHLVLSRADTIHTDHNHNRIWYRIQVSPEYAQVPPCHPLGVLSRTPALHIYRFAWFCRDRY